MSVNFEISNGHYDRVRKYANFFSMTANRFMQMLITMGIYDYKSDYQLLKSTNDNINEIKIMRDKKEKYNTKQRELYKAKKDKNANVDVLETEIRKLKLEIQRYVTRVKVELDEKTEKMLELITKEIRRERKEVSQSDVICSLIQFELDMRLQYLSSEKDLLNDEKYFLPVKVSLNIPQEFYNFICIQAESYNVRPEDYLKILIEEKYEGTYRKE